jgi:hypothetical protein
MRKYLFLFFAICFHSTLQAQNTFEKVIDTLGSAAASCIQETFDGGYVYCGVSIYGGNDVIIVKLDSFGIVDWAKTYSGIGIEYATFVEQTTDSGYLVNAIYNSGLTSLNWLLKIDQNGDTLWTKTFSVGLGGTNVYFGNSMARVGNNLYGLTGFNQSPSQLLSAFFIAIDSNGVQLSSKVYPTLYNSETRSIDRTYDDGFIMAGTIDNASLGADVFVIRTNNYGDTLWTKTYDYSQAESAYDIKQTVDSGFVIVSIAFNQNSLAYNIRLIKTDSVGTVYWTKLFESPYELVPYSIAQTSDNGFIISGSAMNSAFERNVYLIRTNSIGDTLWTRKYYVSINCSGYFVRQTKDNGFIICGLSNTGNSGTYVIKTDSMGIVSTGTGTAEFNNPINFSIFPNPSTGNFTIDLRGIPNIDGNIEIYNLFGQSIYNCSVRNKGLSEIDLSNEENGIYVVVIKTKENIFSEKIVIQN